MYTVYFIIFVWLYVIIITIIYPLLCLYLFMFHINWFSQTFAPSIVLFKAIYSYILVDIGWVILYCDGRSKRICVNLIGSALVQFQWKTTCLRVTSPTRCVRHDLWFQIYIYSLCSPLLGEMIQFDSYFADGLKPPTRRPGESSSQTYLNSTS